MCMFVFRRIDSFCGAIRLLEEGGSPCLVGHNEYPKLAKRQNLFVRTFVIFIQNNLLNLLVLQQIPELL